MRRIMAAIVAVLVTSGLAACAAARADDPVASPPARHSASPSPSPSPFDPSVGAILPTYRIVAYYGVPGAEPTGPAYQLTEAMYHRLQRQGAAYQKLDPAHPVRLGIDLVVSVPDRDPGPDGSYSHDIDDATIHRYMRFCVRHHLLLFLDLDFGRTPVLRETRKFLPYLEHNDYIQLAVDPEWMFPRGDGVPGVNLSNVRAADLNPVIDAVADIPARYHVPRKVVLIHQYRSDGDGLADPHDPGSAEIADKRHLRDTTGADVVIGCDGVGGYAGDHKAKTGEYEHWVRDDIDRYHNFRYGGFKLFYQQEAPTGVMTPAQVLALDPAPMVITYGN
jgi:hypothetical protein